MVRMSAALLFLSCCTAVRAAQQLVDHHTSLRNKAGGTLFVAEGSRHTSEQDTAHYLCKKACEQAKGHLQSRCVTECEKEMYVCRDHSVGEAEFEECKKQLFIKYTKFHD